MRTYYLRDPDGVVHVRHLKFDFDFNERVNLWPECWLHVIPVVGDTPPHPLHPVLSLGETNVTCAACLCLAREPESR